MGKYDDILNRHRPASRRPKMSPLERAAQFSPFAALTGYEDAVRESARRTEDMRILTQEELAYLNEQLRYLADSAGEEPWATFTCFVPDARKAGGAYEAFCGRVKRVDAVAGCVLLTDGRRLPLENLCEIDSPCFRGIFPADL